MRVGLISYNGRARDAIGNHLAEKAGFFVDRGAEVRVFLQNADRLHPALAQHVTTVNEVKSNGPVWDFLEGSDLVIADFSQAYELLPFLPLLAGGKPRLILEYHGITPPRIMPPAQRAALENGLAQRGLAWCVDFVLVHSQFIGAELRQATDFPPDRILQIDFPLDDRFQPNPAQGSLRQRLGLAAARVVLFVGRLAASKCVPVLIEAIARLGDCEPAVHAVVLGDATDVYAAEEDRCRDLAGRLGVGARVHFFGSVADDELADCYRDAEALVIPSLHEGFCVPVLEAQACGLRVIAARCTALPETIGDAGLTFTPGDAEDLAVQLRRVLADNDGPARPATGRVALVSFRFGPEIVGGAETSLRRIAQALRRQGQTVEVFTTCTRAEGDWTNELSAGTFHQDSLLVHRFPIDPHDRERHLESVRAIIEADGQVAPEAEAAYLKHSIHSSALLAALRERHTEFDAIVVGPYLFGLTWDVAQAFRDRVLLLPCFHDEPLGRLKCWPTTYSHVGGILYHSAEERELGQGTLGVNHPNSVEIGTYLEPARDKDGLGVSPCSGKRYVVYCGRYSREKGILRLLDYAARYQAERPGRFAFAFMGQGDIAIPKANWALDLGRVSEAAKRGVLAGAAALVQLSRQESLSLVALEAWAEGTPVLVDRRCAVLAGQVRRSQGGEAIDDYAGFLRGLDDLWDNAQDWRARGRRGLQYVREHYTSEDAFAGRIVAAVAALRVPLRQKLRERGLARATASARPRWRERFGQFVEKVLDTPPRPFRSELVLEPVHERVVVQAGTRSLLVPVRIHNRGSHAVCPGGPAATLLCCAVEGRIFKKTPLPAILMPGKSQSAAALLAVPLEPGEYVMRMWLEGGRQDSTAPAFATVAVGAEGAGGCAAPFLAVAQEALAAIEQRRQLPDTYLDVTEGRLARFKRWIKQKMLGNFKRGYVDVLSRQQSQVNRHVLASLQQLTECCATIEHALGCLRERLDAIEERLGSNGAHVTSPPAIPTCQALKEAMPATEWPPGP
jgi:glycosyltransferase involved in cell wall biosynthesis